MKKTIGKYIVEIKFYNGFDKSQLTVSRISHIQSRINSNEFDGTFDIWCDDGFVEDVEETTKWDESMHGAVFYWKCIGYSTDITNDDSKIVTCYHYMYNDNVEFYPTKSHVMSDTPIFDSRHTLISVGKCSMKIINEWKNKTYDV